MIPWYQRPSNSAGRILMHYLHAWLILCVGLAITAYVTTQVKQDLEEGASRQIAFTADQVALKLKERLNSYALILRGAAGLFAGSSTVSRADWRAYVEKLRAEDSVPGVQGIGYSVAIPPKQLAAHVGNLRSARIERKRFYRRFIFFHSTTAAHAAMHVSCSMQVTHGPGPQSWPIVGSYVDPHSGHSGQHVHSGSPRR